MSDAFLLNDTVNRCFCPHTPPECCLNGGCCGACVAEAEERDLEDEAYDDE